MSETPGNPPPIVPPVPPPAAARLPAPRRRIWPIVLLAFTVFAAGAGLGVAGTVIVIVRRAQYAAQHPAEVLTNRIGRRLQLSPAQKTQVEQILTRRQKRIINRVQPEVQKELDEIRTEIAAVLTPEQQQRWDAAYDEMESQWLPKDK